LTGFLYANRYPPRIKVRGRLSLENALRGSDDDPGDASGGNALTGRVKAPMNADRRPIQKARDRFPGAGSILATMNICR
jgi:hypothetical protein